MDIGSVACGWAGNPLHSSKGDIPSGAQAVWSQVVSSAETVSQTFSRPIPENYDHIETSKPKTGWFQNIIGNAGTVLLTTCLSASSILIMAANTATLGATKLLKEMNLAKETTSLSGLVENRLEAYDLNNKEDRRILAKDISKMKDAAFVYNKVFTEKEYEFPGFSNVGRLLFAHPPPQSAILDKLQKIPESLKAMIDPQTGILKNACGLHACLFVNNQTGNLHLSFEGSELNLRKVGRFTKTWSSNLAQMFGFLPPIYRSADRLVLSLKKILGEQANKLCLSGHSLGGGLAQYAGCKNQVKTFAFNGASIHFRNRLRLGRDLIEAAKDNVFCINLEDEFLSKHLECPGYRIMPVYQLGRELKIKPRKKKHKNLNPFKRHSVIPIEDVLREYEDGGL